VADGDYGLASWEAIITQVVVDGRPADIRDAANGWQALQSALSGLAGSIDIDVGKLGDAWTGAAYDAYQAHLTGITEVLRNVVDEAQRMGSVVGTLNEAATQLEAAQRNVFVPPLAIPEVDAAIAARYPVPENLFQPKVIEEAENLSILNSWTVDATNLVETPWGEMTIEAYVARATEENRKVWVALNDEVAIQSEMTPPGPTAVPNATTGAGAVALASAGPTGGPAIPPPVLPGAGAPPAGATVPPPDAAASPPGTGASTPAGTGLSGSGGGPSLNADSGGFDPSATGPAAEVPEIGNAGGFSPGASGAPPGGIDRPEIGGTGLAGAGGGAGLGGAGLGGLSGGGSPGGIPGGLPGGLSGGAPAGGPVGSAGGLPIGSGGVPLGGGAGGGAPGRRGTPSVSAAPGISPVAPTRGAGGAGGAGRGGKPILEGGIPHPAGSTAGRPGTPGVGGFGGAAGTGFTDEEEHTTWLEEDDENVWGYGNGAPGVLR
jgi:uncharacterized protein YukE